MTNRRSPEFKGSRRIGSVLCGWTSRGQNPSQLNTPQTQTLFPLFSFSLTVVSLFSLMLFSSLSLPRPKHEHANTKRIEQKHRGIQEKRGVRGFFSFRFTPLSFSPVRRLHCSLSLFLSLSLSLSSPGSLLRSHRFLTSSPVLSRISHL